MSKIIDALKGKKKDSIKKNEANIPIAAINHIPAEQEKPKSAVKPTKKTYLVKKPFKYGGKLYGAMEKTELIADNRKLFDLIKYRFLVEISSIKR